LGRKLYGALGKNKQLRERESKGLDSQIWRNTLALRVAKEKRKRRGGSVWG